MSKSQSTVMTKILLEMCEGLHPMPEGWMFVGVLSDEYGAMKATLCGDELRICEDLGDAYCNRDEGELRQAVDSDDTSGNDGI